MNHILQNRWRWLGDNGQFRQSLSRPRIEPVSSHIQSRSAVHSTLTFGACSITAISACLVMEVQLAHFTHHCHKITFITNRFSRCAGPNLMEHKWKFMRGHISHHSLHCTTFHYRKQFSKNIKRPHSLPRNISPSISSTLDTCSISSCLLSSDSVLISRGISSSRTTSLHNRKHYV